MVGVRGKCALVGALFGPTIDDSCRPKQMRTLVMTPRRNRTAPTHQPMNNTRKSRASLGFERLEDRLTPATYTWDSAAGTLAISLAANEDLTITGGAVRSFLIDTGTF